LYTFVCISLYWYAALSNVKKKYNSLKDKRKKVYNVFFSIFGCYSESKLMKRFAFKILFICILAFFSRLGYTQSLDQAKKWYNEGLFEEAKPVFEKLVKQSPNNSSYSLWYGVCCYETDELETAEKYLLLARNRKVTDACRYLATMYTSTYRFKEAATMWEDYIDQLTKKKENTEVYESQLERVEKLSRMRDRAEDVQIIDSMVVSKDKILSAYFLSEDCGVLQMDGDFFLSFETPPSTVYINPKGDRAFYARPAPDGRFTLYTQTKLLDIWTDEKPLFPADTEENNYPFVLGDGVTIYFASKGNGSIGGYDLFVTRYNTNSNAYLAPEQLSMPFNSPSNDYLMVVDEVKGLGWFVSDRFQPEDKVCVYLFIPNDSRKYFEESESDESLNGRAALTSIHDTWLPGSNYEELILLAKANISNTYKQEIRDFEFVVNDRTVYYSLADFRSPEAKSFFERVIGLKQQANTVESDLVEKRNIYTLANQSVKDQMRPVILQTETELRILFSQIDEWEKRTRNSENRYLLN